MKGFDSIKGDELKTLVLSNFWLKRFVKRHWGLRVQAAMLLMLMQELGRPITNAEWSSMNSDYSFAKAARDLMQLESKGFIRKYKVMTDDLADAKRKTGVVKLQRVVVQSVMSYRYCVTDTGASVCQQIVKNMRHRKSRFTMGNIKDSANYGLD